VNKGDAPMKKGKLIGKIFEIALVFVMIGAMLGGLPALSVSRVEASPGTIYVPDDYTTIQAAVDAANPGDTIIVKDGTYTENVNVNKDHLTVQSENGAETTIVQAANPNDHVFSITADSVNIDGFTIRDATEVSAISLYHVKHCNISDNNVMNNRSGISLQSSSNNAISDNTCNSNAMWGIYLHSSNNNMLSGNTCNFNSYCGIQLDTSSSINTLSGNTCNSNDCSGIILVSSSNDVTDNTCNLNKYCGIELSCSSNTLADNTCNSNYLGIQLSHSSSNSLTNNTATDNYDGIYLFPSSNNDNLMNNAVTNNRHWGIFVSSSGCNLINNTATHNDGGIKLGFASNNTVTSNNVLSNMRFGIMLDDSDNNKIYLNNLIDNPQNAYDDTGTNAWTSTRRITYKYNGNTHTSYLGNYWSDYEDRYPGAGEIDSTGIWDTPYSIDSDADNYPLTEPFENYEVGDSTYYADFLRMVQWLATQQRADGGVQEAEDYPETITDNTAESIWTWSCYAELTGDYTTYLQNINDAWDFCYAHPSWEEFCTDWLGWEYFCYYTVYNVGWGLLAETKYREAYEGRPEYVDHLWYGEQCADTLVDYTPSTGDTRSALCLGLAAGSLYQYGISVGNSVYCLRALELGDNVRQWLEADVTRFASESWAVSSGVAVWGVLNSYFQENLGGDSWVENFASHMPLDAHDSENNSYEYGHDGWYAWGYYASSRALDGGDYFGHYQNILDYLLSADGDEDGGIPRGPTYTDNQDFAWVTNVAAFALNLGLLGLEDITPPTVSSVSPEDGDTDVPVDTVVTATFSEAMDSSTITTESFTLEGSLISGTVEYDPAAYTATFIPDSDLDYDHEYTATLSTTITDLSSNPLAKSYTWSFTTGSAPNQPPNPPDALFQLQSDWTTEIPVGGEISDTTIVFKGVADDPDGDQVKLQIELRQLDEYGGQFDETQGGLKESEFVKSGSDTIAFAYELVESNYHWRARAVDQRGKVSEWIDFGNNDISEADFILLPNQSPVARFTYSPEKPKAGEWITFDASESHDPDGKIEFYKWDLNNDGIYEEFTIFPKLKCLWNKAGAYEIGLIVIDYDGAESEKMVKTVTVETSFWDRVGDFFEDIWPWGGKIKQIEDADLSMIKEELEVKEWLSTTDFDWCNDYDLKMALNREMDPEKAPGLTYGIYILNGISEKELLENVLSQEYKLAAGTFFNNFIDSNTGWSALAGTLTKQFLSGLTGPGVGSLLLAIDVTEGAIPAAYLERLLLYNTLWTYFENRKSGDTHADAWSNACSGPWSQNYFYDNERIQKRFEDLWETYKGFLSENPPPYLKEKPIREELRDILLSALEKCGLPDRYITTIGSPVEIRVYDSQGNVAGSVSGEAREEIPYSAYNDETKMVIIFFQSDSYRYEVVGIEEGTYGLDIASIEDGEATTFAATGIPTAPESVHQYTIDWDTLSQGEEGVTLQIDSDGDGEFEDTFTSDEELTGDEFISQFAGCFIATAAYGTPMAEEIEILREFRDEYLLTNPVGKGLVGFYYRVSPPMAEFITEHPSLKPIVRTVLVPAVVMSTVVVNTTPAEKAAIVGLLVLVSVALAVWAKRRRGRGPEYT
jgi:parallel beta-helix repeat protein